MVLCASLSLPILGQNTITYVYDAAGNRVVRTASGNYAASTLMSPKSVQVKPLNAEQLSFFAAQANKRQDLTMHVRKEEMLRCGNSKGLLRHRAGSRSTGRQNQEKRIK